MLQEVYEWFIVNFKSTERATSVPAQPKRPGSNCGTETGFQPPAAGLTFAVSESSQGYGASLNLRCAQAIFHPRWHTDLLLFQCRCQRSNDSQTSSNALSGEFHQEQLHYLCTRQPLHFVDIPLIGLEIGLEIGADHPKCHQ